MSLEQAAYLAEVFGVIVIVLTLIYLSVQVRQGAEQARMANQAMQESGVQEAAGMLMDWHVAIASNDELSRIMFVGRSSPFELNDIEWARFTDMALMIYGLWEFSFLKFRDNAFPESHWIGFESMFKTFACDDGYRKFVDEQESGFSPLFREYIQTEVLSAGRLD